MGLFDFDSIVLENEEQKIQLESRMKLIDTLIDSLKDIVYILDPDATIIEVSKRIEDYGFKTEEIRGQPFSNFVVDEYQEVARQLVIERREKMMEMKKGVRRQYSQEIELPFITKTKNTRDMEVSAGAFIADFYVESIRIHKGEPIKKNHIYTIGIARDVSERKKLETEKAQLITDLQAALEQVNQLKGLIPICANCKKIRDDKGYWNHLESYIEKHSEAQFSHGICQECADELYKDEKWYKKLKNK